MTDTAAAQSQYAEMTSEIVSAYVANNHVSPGDMPALIRSVHDTLADLGKPAPAVEPQKLVPAVPIKKSVTDDYIISLEDGRKLKSMKRYLAGLGMTPAEYRAKWGLPADYPVVAPAYAAFRSSQAKGMGLGRKPAKTAPEPQPEPEAVTPPSKKRGRAKKAA